MVQDHGVLVILDGIPGVHQGVMHKMKRFILHMLHDPEPGDHTKILMPTDDQQMALG
jgi:hypothetical protein